MHVTKIGGLDLLLKSYLFIPKILFRKAVKKYGAHVRGKTLDIGSGLQPFREYFESSQYITLDANPELHPDVVGSITALPFKDGEFDSVLCFEVLEHVADTATSVKEITRVLKHGGTLMVSTPMHWPLHYEPEDYYRFTKYGLQEVFKKDFRVLHAEKIGGLFSFVGSRFAEESALFLYRLFPALPRRVRYALGHIANIPLSLFFYALSVGLDWLFPEDAISWLLISKRN